MGVFCDAGCEAHFTASTVTITHHDRMVLTGTRTPSTRLWHPQPPQLNSKPEQACGAIGSATPAEIVAFTHAALFSPALSILEHALTKGFLVNFPGMTLAQVRKHPPRSIQMYAKALVPTVTCQKEAKPCFSLGALFHNAKEACLIRTSLEERGHPQPPTPMKTDNSTATVIANENRQQHCHCHSQ